MSLHPGMKMKTRTGKTVKVIRVAGNDILIKSRKSTYWVTRNSLK